MTNSTEKTRVIHKTTYFLLAFFLGGLGAHKFYAGQIVTGLTYILFCWTGIPALLSVVEAFIVLSKPTDQLGNLLSPPSGTISVRDVVATGIGAALFVVIGLLINIPTFVPNTSIQLQYAVQALLSVVFGPFVGFFIGLIGHTLKDSLTYGPWWSWILASGVVGLVIGFAKNRLRVEEGIFEGKDILVFNIFQVVANVIAWGIIAPVLDIVIYSEAANKVFTQGLVAGIVNSITIAIAGTILLGVYARSQTKTGSLSKD